MVGNGDRGRHKKMFIRAVAFLARQDYLGVAQSYHLRFSLSSPGFDYRCFYFVSSNLVGGLSKRFWTVQSPKLNFKSCTKLSLCLHLSLETSANNAPECSGTFFNWSLKKVFRCRTNWNEIVFQIFFLKSRGRRREKKTWIRFFVKHRNRKKQLFFLPKDNFFSLPR